MTVPLVAQQLPALNWEPRSDWINIKTDVTPNAVGNGVAAAADDEKLDEGQAVPPAPTAPKKPSSNVPANGKPVDARVRSRLESQIDNFLKDLSKPEFVRDCSATQLIQAVCFPLAVAVRGQKRGWVSAASAEQWGLKLVSLLFRGRTAGSPGLLGAVEQRGR